MRIISKALLCASSLTLLLAACEKQGGTANPEDTSADAAPPADGEPADGEPHHGGEDHEHDFPGGVKTFHDLLSPLWHAEPGDERTANTCNAVADMLTKAQAVAAEAAPEAASSEDDWKARGGELVTAVQGLQAACEGDRAGFDGAFEGVHDAFHALIEVIGQGH
ncbi:MAG: hypothetical protein KC457_32510 [Myxococcales bacterium]|nr:hypothetical protein [Myxococcales bacterium]